MTRSSGNVALAIGPVTAIAVAGLLSRFRTSTSSVNVALILALVVVLAALAGRKAGLATALAATIAYNFFLTRPYHSLRINSAHDIVTVVLLGALGVIVSEAGAWRRREHSTAVVRLHAAGALEAVGAKLAAGATADEIWTDVRAALIDLLHLTDCRLEKVPAEVTIPRSGSLVGPKMQWGPDGFWLPESGASLPVEYHGRTLGHIRLIPEGTRGTSYVARQAAVALADLYAVAAGTTP
jgi:hypothetical protein